MLEIFALPCVMMISFSSGLLVPSMMPPPKFILPNDVRNVCLALPCVMMVSLLSAGPPVRSMMPVFAYFMAMMLVI
jgi:hypothetical protein